MVPAGNIDPPALTVGRAADVQVGVGADPLGIASILRQDPEEFRGGARALVTAAAEASSGAGASARTARRRSR